MSASRGRSRKKGLKTDQFEKIPGISLNTEDKDNEINNEVEESHLEKLKMAIEKVGNMPWTPSVFVFNIKWKDSLSAVDLNPSHSLVACAAENSSDIYVEIHAEENLPQAEVEHLLLNYNSLKVAKEEYEKRTAHLSTVKYLTGHSLPVTGLKFVPKRNLLLSCSLDGTVKAWNTENLAEVKSYKGTEDFYRDIDVSYNSTLFATSGVKGTVCLFTFESRIPVEMFSGHTEDVNCVRFHPNGIYFATASDDKTIKLWSTQTGNVARSFQDDRRPKSLAFSPDGKYLASYSGGNIKMWDLASGQLFTMFADSDDISSSCCLCFSEFGGVLASGGTQKKFKLWDVKNLSSGNQIVSDDGSMDSKSHLLKSNYLQRKIKLIKFDENNYFTCVTV